MICPKCQAPMRQYERAGVTIDQCSECRGIFLDRGELERLVDAEDKYSRGSHGAPSAPPPAPGYPAQGYPTHGQPGYAQPGYGQQQPYPTHSSHSARYGTHGSYGHHGHRRHRGHRRNKSFFDDLFG
ncbi:zf-TFIIB domain-containing protein [Cryptosporangium aurantiacum]|uniref:Transcription factor zinc-finger domain-containing protein n=1 Tax=Cryptosporangium aurantiacum TaxID=134849 RepID=A0A1M7IQN7_9ACTN|nr:zf-TFIIB domain-containing protein [Cryptosporangium aurantiacum]SHM43001.1 hypothetical protein SAMN05443668_101564 [Cryptosporangium aurantiacum]